MKWRRVKPNPPCVLFRSTTVFGPPQGKGPSGGALSFGDAPSLRPGVGCGDKGGVSNAAGWVWAASPHSAPQPPALGSAGKPPQVPGDPS